MTDPREALLAALDAEEALARAATPGPWWWASEARLVSAETRDVCTDRFMLGEDQAFIAANSPEKALARIAAVRAVIAEHGEIGARPSGSSFAGWCQTCEIGWPCRTVSPLLDAWMPGWRDA